MSDSPEISRGMRPALANGVRLQADRVTGEPLLLSSEGVHILNSTAEEIVKRCDGASTLGEIIDALAAEYDVAPEELEADVLSCVLDLRSRKLIVPQT
jgi:coenzyme PQQ biosynthesis protein PqqD